MFFAKSLPDVVVFMCLRFPVLFVTFKVKGRSKMSSALTQMRLKAALWQNAYLNF